MNQSPTPFDQDAAIAALNETIDKTDATANSLARGAGLDASNLRKVARNQRGMSEEAWTALAAAAPEGSALRALFPDAATPATETASGAIVMVPFGKLLPNPDNYRKTFDDAEQDELAESILIHGILQNLVSHLPDADGNYVLNSGGRRYDALLRLRLSDRIDDSYLVPILPKKMNDAEARALAIIENIQRQDVPVLEEAAGFQALIEMGWKTETISDAVKISVRTVQDRLQLATRLTTPVRDALSARKITLDQARAIMSVPGEADQSALLDYAVDYEYTAKALRDQAKRGKVPVSAAAFDLKLYTGEYLGEGKHRVFCDTDQFATLQLAEAEKQARALRDRFAVGHPMEKRFTKVTVLPFGQRWNSWEYIQLPEGQQGEAFVWLNWDNSIEIAEDVIPKASASDGEDDDDDASQAEYEARQAAIEEKNSQIAEFVEKLRQHYIKSPLDYLRLSILATFMDYNWDNYPDVLTVEWTLDNAGFETIFDEVRTELHMPELFPTKINEDGTETGEFTLITNDDQLREVWSRLQGLDTQKVISLYARITSSQIRKHFHSSIDIATSLLIDTAKIDVPECLRRAEPVSEAEPEASDEEEAA